MKIVLLATTVMMDTVRKNVRLMPIVKVTKSVTLILMSVLILVRLMMIVLQENIVMKTFAMKNVQTMKIVQTVRFVILIPMNVQKIV